MDYLVQFHFTMSLDFLFETVDENTPIEELADCLKEDLIQIKYKDEYLIDVGWYPEFDEDGSFKILVIKSFDWENPLIEVNCKTLLSLKNELCRLIEEIGEQS